MWLFNDFYLNLSKIDQMKGIGVNYFAFYKEIMTFITDKG